MTNPKTKRLSYRETKAYACIGCGELHATGELADACCRCSTCGTKTHGCHTFFKDNCAHCEIKERRASLRSARAATLKQLRTIDKDIRRFQGPLPPKGTPTPAQRRTRKVR